MKTQNKNEERRIGDIGNYYGGLSVKKEDGKFYWSIENYSGHSWEQIPKTMFDQLIKFQNEKDRSKRK